MTTMGYTVLGRLALVAIGNERPSDHEWATYSEHLASIGLKVGGMQNLRVVVITDGGGPGTLARRRADEVAQGRPPRASIITRSPAARGIVTVFTWLDYPIRAFAPERWREAFDYAEADANAFGGIKREFALLGASVGVHLVNEVTSLIPG